MAVQDPRERYAALSAEAIASGDPTAWFDRLYSESALGTARIPWDRAAPHPLLDPPPPSPGTPARALVVGCGLGDDAELISSLGYRTVAFDLSPAAQAMDWSDGLISQGSKVILAYDHPHFGQFPAVVSTEHGQGRITTVGTLPNPALAADLARWLAPQQQERWNELPESVTVNSATNRDGQRIHVVHNWSWQPVTLALPQPLTDVLDNESQPIQEIALGPWDVRVLAA